MFVNPALTEPFGLTLIEAAACGLPIVATEDGGPRDIIDNCQNGYLVNPLETDLMAKKLLLTLTDSEAWTRLSQNGIRNVAVHYSWQSHVEKYLEVIRPLITDCTPTQRMIPNRRAGAGREQALFTSLDLNLIGDTESLPQLLDLIRVHRKLMIFGIATGRRLGNAVGVLRKYGIPLPDVLITGQGTAIHYSSNLTKDVAWQRHINHLWNAQAVRDVLSDLPGLVLQPSSEQSEFQISYFIDTNVVSVADIRKMLQRNDLAVNLVNAFGRYLDVLPVRASKGLALRWCAEQFDFPLENTLIAGVTSADADMLLGNTLGAVLDSQHREELTSLKGVEKVFFSSVPYAEGIIEAMHHYGFPLIKA